MRCTTNILARIGSTAALGLALVATAGSARAAGPGPADSVKPLVLILLDTSGSMEYEAGDATTAAQEFTVPVCEGVGSSTPTKFAPGDYPKSRLTIAKEVLTGTYRDYWCKWDYRTDSAREDYGYPIPRSLPCSDDAGACTSPAQDFNGLLDLRRDDFKFGIMTYDSKESTDTGPAGMYSFGADKAIGINLGIRNEIWGAPNNPNQWSNATGDWVFSDVNRSQNNRGQLIVPRRADTEASVRNDNLLVQYEIGTTMGYWGSPMAPMLEDARELLMTHTDVRPYNSVTDTGDPYANCRDKVVILITDGRATQGEGVGGYMTTQQAVLKLKNTPPLGVRVYVVGFNLANSDATLLDELHPDNGGAADGVYVADSPADLAGALSDIFSTVLGDIRSRTMVTYTNATRSNVDLQYQFNAAYGPDPNLAINQVGYLDQTIYRCDPACAAVTAMGESCARDLVPIHEKLNATPDEDRELRFFINGELRDIGTGDVTSIASNKAKMAKIFNVPQSGQLLDPDSLADDTAGPIVTVAADILGNAVDYLTQVTYVERLISFLKSETGSARENSKLGAITRATPVVQERALAGRYPLRSWNLYVNTPQGSGYAPKCRPTVLYTGTHEGFIHAFRVDRLESATGECAEQAVPAQTEDDVGKELWAVMPQFLLQATHTLLSSTAFLMDGKLHVADVMLSRTDPTAANADPADEALQWRSVLTAGFGQGGFGYVALDVTNPLSIDDVDVLFEIGKDGRCYAGTCHNTNTFKNDFSNFGLTVGRPAYGTAFLDGREVAIAVLPGGDTDNDPTRPYAGKVVYIVRLDNGEKVAEFSEAEGNVTALDGSAVTLEYPITGSPAVYSDVPGVVSTRAFVGDAGGRMWRIDMANADPATWRMQLFHDAYDASGPMSVATPSDRQPVMGAPKLAVDGPFGHVAVIYGTGDLDYLTATADAKAGIYSVSEVTAIDGTITMQVNWSKVFQTGEVLTGEPEVFDQAAYFTTFLEDTSDACNDGSGRLYGVHFTRRDEGAPSSDNTVPALDADGDPTTSDVVQYISTGTSIPYGVQVIERPACMPDGTAVTGSSGGAGGGVSRGATELVVNVAKGNYGSPSTQAPGAAGSAAKTRSITHALQANTETLQSAAWGYVLY